tara:strand:+ start:858 stop:1127 length:270 start_codon:yes stop_codon:yes gene_type:complete
LSKKIRKYKKQIKHPINLLEVGDVIEPTDPNLKKEIVGIIISIKEDELMHTKDKLQIFWVNSGKLTWELHSDLLINFEFYSLTPYYDEE